MRALRYFLRFLSLLLLLGVAGLIAAYAYIRSDAGLARIAREVNMRASSEDMRIELTALRGDPFSDITLGRLTLADRDGVWLELHDLHVVWSPRSLLRKQAPLTLVEAGNITLLRTPVPSSSTAASSGTESSAPLSDYATYLPRNLTIKELRVAETVAGIEQRVSITGAGDAARYALALATLQGVPLSLDALVQPQQEHFAAKITFRESEGGVVAALAGLPNNIPLSLDADIAADSAGDITIHTARLQAGSLSADARGSYQASAGQMDIALSATAPDMQVPQALSGIAMSGSADVTLEAKGTLDALAVSFAAHTPHLVVQENRIDAFHFTANASLNPAAWGSDAFMAEGTLSSEGTHNGQPVTFALTGSAKEGHISLPDLAVRYGANRASGTLAAQGTLARFTLTSDLALDTPEGASTLALNGTVDTDAARYTGDAKGSFSHQAHRFQFATTLDADAARADITALSLKGPGVQIEGSARIAITEQLADASLTVRASDLAPLGKLIRHPLSGSLTADVMLAHSGGIQRADITAKARTLGLPGLRIAAADIAARISDARALEGVDTRMQINGISMADIEVSSLQATAKGGRKGGLSIALEGTGSAARAPWDLSLEGKAQQPGAQHYRLDLARLSGSYDGAPLRMASPVTLLHRPGLTSLSPLTLQLAGGSLRGEAKLEGKAVSGKAVISALALQKLPVPGLPDATLDATLTLAGTGSAPILTWQAKTDAVIDGMTLTATAKGEWQNGTLASGMAVRSDEAMAEAQVTLPARLSLQPFATDLGDRTALKGRVTAGLPLSMFNARLRPDGHRLGGNFTGDASLAGTLGNPHFTGGFTLADGRYDHTTTGICLRGITARISGSKQAVTLEEFSATDSERHRFTAAASLALAGTPTLKGEASFDRFKLFCGGMMNGQIDGTLAAQGTTKAMTVAGKLVLGPLNIQIPGARVSSNIPEVETHWIRPGEQQRNEDTSPSVIALDISVEAPRQLFIRGRGLDAEFAGALAITGTTSTPKIDGQFDKKRGTFLLLDRVLALNTATITFKGPIPPSPFLKVDASTKVNANTLTVALSGNAAKPKLTLSSSPALPQDEVLALLLFGRQLQRISPFEALQLAQATRTLAGLDGGGPGIVGSIRDALGLDRLEVGADEDSNVSVSTGKYVTDDVYVGVVQGAKPEDREIVTEITLTPSVSGKTAVDSIGNQSIGVEWKHDY